MNRILPGHPYPLGATWDGQGVNFAVFSENAERIELCLFADERSEAEQERIILTEVSGGVFHAYVRDLGPGQLYGYRAHGEFAPERGLRFNPAKLLLDPYVTAVSGRVDWDAPVFGYPLEAEDKDLVRDDRDDAAGVPRGVVVESAFDWGEDRPPGTPWRDTIIYETHVKGLTIRHPDVAPELRGTYAGVADPAVVKHLVELGITSLELMPVHEFVDDKILVERGLSNYWGYNTINFFSPAARYSGAGDLGGQVREFKTMVKTLHRAGLEVILDVVYNHTAEGNHLGPTLCYRGLDNPTYYRLVEDDPRYYVDFTGTGNSPNMGHPQVLKLIMDSLRYWVEVMHVDGFRFDLAATLARELHDVDHLSAFFDIIHQDPVLSRVKLIAEPWDVGEGGYQVGNFPALWAEWNGRYRDAVRRFWRGNPGQAAEIGFRITGSSDLYEMSGRRPTASVNFVTAHDGFTLADLVSYERKHNEANGEDGRDGADENLSVNCGVEGPSEDPAVLGCRDRLVRSFLATLFASQGVPMLLGGDEIGRTQRGNNNAYGQDNPISWYDWDLDERRTALLAFTRRVIALRRGHAALHRPKFFQGRPIRGAGIKDLVWLRADGEEMSDEDWAASDTRCLGLMLAGCVPELVDHLGEPLTGDTLLLLLNSNPEPVSFVLPLPDSVWELRLDTASGEPPPPERRLRGGDSVTAEPGAVLLLAETAADRPSKGRRRRPAAAPDSSEASATENAGAGPRNATPRR